jgi:hypothetical protein
VEEYTLLGGILRDYLSRPLSGLKNTADSIYRGLDIKFVKEEVLHLVKVGSRPVAKVLKQSLSSRNISNPQYYTKTTY